MGQAGWRPFPFRLNRNGGSTPLFDAFSSREPVSTSLENALTPKARKGMRHDVRSCSSKREDRRRRGSYGRYRHSQRPFRCHRGQASEADGPAQDLAGRLVTPGLVETHIHLDKSCLLGRCNCEQGTLDEAIAEVASAKKTFTEEDVYARARNTLEKSLKHGTTRMRTHVEVDPRIGLTSFRALQQLKKDYAWAIDLELCVFPQEGLLDDPGCEDVMIEAPGERRATWWEAPPTWTRTRMDRSAASSISPVASASISIFILIFGLDPAHLDLNEVCRLADHNKWGGRVAIGHVTKLSALAPDQLERAARRLAGAGVAVTVLPATDLFLTGRDFDRNVPPRRLARPSSDGLRRQLLDLDK